MKLFCHSHFFMLLTLVTVTNPNNYSIIKLYNCVCYLKKKVIF